MPIIFLFKSLVFHIIMHITLNCYTSSLVVISNFLLLIMRQKINTEQTVRTQNKQIIYSAKINCMVTKNNLTPI